MPEGNTTTPEAAEATIQIAPASLNSGREIFPARHIPSAEALKSLRDVQSEIAATEKRVAAEREALERRRQEALELQQTWEDLKAAAQNLRGEIETGDRVLADAQAKLAECDAYFEKMAGRPEARFADHAQLELNVRFSIARYPAWLERRREQLKVLEKDLAAFARKHGIDLPKK